MLKTLPQTFSGRLFSKYIHDIFSTLLVALTLKTQRQFFKYYPNAFTSDDAITNISRLTFTQSFRAADAGLLETTHGKARVTTTTTTTTFNMTREASKMVLQQILDAKLFENAADISNTIFKDRAVWVLTAKGLDVLERFIHQNGIHSPSLLDLCQTYPAGPKPTVFLDRRESDDGILFSNRVMLEHVFSRFAGAQPPAGFVGVAVSGSAESVYRSGIGGGDGGARRFAGYFSSAQYMAQQAAGGNVGVGSSGAQQLPNGQMAHYLTRQTTHSNRSTASGLSSASNATLPLPAQPPGVPLKRLTFGSTVYDHCFTSMAGLSWLHDFTTAIQGEAGMVAAWFVRLGWIGIVSESGGKMMGREGSIFRLEGDDGVDSAEFKASEKTVYRILPAGAHLAWIEPTLLTPTTSTFSTSTPATSPPSSITANARNSFHGSSIHSIISDLSDLPSRSREPSSANSLPGHVDVDASISTPPPSPERVGGAPKTPTMPSREPALIESPESGMTMVGGGGGGRALSQQQQMMMRTPPSSPEKGIAGSPNNGMGSPMGKDSNSAKLQRILDEPALKSLFRTYLANNFCEENLQFWLDVEDVRRRFATTSSAGAVISIPGTAASAGYVTNPHEKMQEHLLDKALLIYSTYLSPGSPSEINISSIIRSDISSLMPRIFAAANRRKAAHAHANAQAAVSSDGLVRLGSSGRGAEPVRSMASQLPAVLRLYEQAQRYIFRGLVIEHVPKFTQSDSIARLLRKLDFESSSASNAGPSSLYSDLAASSSASPPHPGRPSTASRTTGHGSGVIAYPLPIKMGSLNASTGYSSSSGRPGTSSGRK